VKTKSPIEHRVSRVPLSKTLSVVSLVLDRN
jgi:hypothetical protein